MIRKAFAALHRLFEPEKTSVLPEFIAGVLGHALHTFAHYQTAKEVAETHQHLQVLDNTIAEMKRRMSVATTASGERVHFDNGGDPEGRVGPATPMVSSRPIAEPGPFGVGFTKDQAVSMLAYIEAAASDGNLESVRSVFTQARAIHAAEQKK